MMQLLFDCGIFAAIDARKGIYYQLSGMILSKCGERDRLVVMC
jgi:telomerase reverse transcriptase